MPNGAGRISAIFPRTSGRYRQIAAVVLRERDPINPGTSIWPVDRSGPGSHKNPKSCREEKTGETKILTLSLGHANHLKFLSSFPNPSFSPRFDRRNDRPLDDYPAWPSSRVVFLCTPKDGQTADKDGSG